MRLRASIFRWRRWKTFLLAATVASLLILQFSFMPALGDNGSKETVASRTEQTEAQPRPAQDTQDRQARPTEQEEPAIQWAKAEEPPPAKKATEPEVKKEEPAQEPKEEEKEREEKETEELTNESCADCHNPDILDWSKEDLQDNVVIGDKGPQPARKRPLFVFGELNLSVDPEKYGAGAHGETTCLECHKDVEELPHKQRLNRVDCADCHDDAVEAVKASAHGEAAGDKAPTCIGCHDVHYGKIGTAEDKGWQKKHCVDCHKAYGLDTVAAHKDLYEAERHMAHGCLMCHQGAQAGVHSIASAKTKTTSCQACHNKYTLLAAEKPAPIPITYTGFINEKVRNAYGYVIGANRIPLLDLIVILAVLGPLALPIIHGGGRILTRRKGPLKLPEEKILLHPAFERAWHWFQALCIVMLIITGVALHWPEKFSVGAFQWAVDWHNIFGWGAVIAWLAWLAYNIGSGRIKHYIPRSGEIPTGMIKQARFYGYGIFKHEPHPYAPSEDNKFNPLQKIAYLKFQVFLFPILLISGLLYMYPQTFKGVIDAIGGMTVLAIVHYLLAAVFTAFLVAHLYLATTGETIGENFKAIIFGYGIKADEHH